MSDKTEQKENRKKEVSADKTALPPTPPDGGWGWVVTFSSFMISVLVDGVCFSQGIFFTEFLDYFGQSKSKTSWVGSVLNGSYLTVGPIVGSLVNTYGCRKVAVIGAIVASASFFISTFSPNIETLTCVYGFMGGVGFGCMYLPAIVMVGYYFEKKRALATGIACCGSGIGMFVFAPLSEVLLDEYNWIGATWILSGLVLNGIIFSMSYRALKSPEPSLDSSVSVQSIQMDDIDETVAMSSAGNKQGIVRSSDKGSSTKKTGSGSSSADNGTESTSTNNAPMYRSRSVELALNRLEKGTAKYAKMVPERIARLGHSQDIGTTHRTRHNSTHEHKGTTLQPLERKDIYYSGSIMHLKEYVEAGSTAEFTKAMLRKSHDSLSSEADSFRHGRIASVLIRIGRAVVSVADTELLTSPTFLIYCLSCFLCMLGFFVPFVYIPSLATDLGISLQRAAFLISIIGITNTVGRVGVGILSDQPWADCLLINNIALIMAGAVTILVPFYKSYGLLAAYVAVFGLGIAVFVSLRSIIMVELMGLEKLTNAFGLVIMCQGLSSYIGAPIAGSIADAFGSYDAAFYLAGMTLALGGVICLPLRRISQRERRLKEKKLKEDSKETEPMVS